MLPWCTPAWCSNQVVSSWLPPHSTTCDWLLMHIHSTHAPISICTDSGPAWRGSPRVRQVGGHSWTWCWEMWQSLRSEAAGGQTLFHTRFPQSGGSSSRRAYSSLSWHRWYLLSLFSKCIYWEEEFQDGTCCDSLVKCSLGADNIWIEIIDSWLVQICTWIDVRIDFLFWQRSNLRREVCGMIFLSFLFSQCEFCICISLPQREQFTPIIPISGGPIELLSEKKKNLKGN